MHRRLAVVLAAWAGAAAIAFGVSEWRQGTGPPGPPGPAGAVATPDAVQARKDSFCIAGMEAYAAAAAIPDGTRNALIASESNMKQALDMMEENC